MTSCPDEPSIRLQAQRAAHRRTGHARVKAARQAANAHDRSARFWSAAQSLYFGHDFAAALACCQKVDLGLLPKHMRAPFLRLQQAVRKTVKLQQQEERRDRVAATPDRRAPVDLARYLPNRSLLRGLGCLVLFAALASLCAAL